jgi:Uma2 family endonuclease
MANITSIEQLDLNGTYTYADYLTWQFDEMLELIKGKIMLMAAPGTAHQTISIRLTGILYPFFKTKNCRLFAAPFDVRLYDKNKSVQANEDIYTTVQPDLCVICDTKKLDTQGCLGAPDWIIEIVSKSNSKRDIQTKYQLYQESGVKEYWIIYPFEEAIHQFILDEGTQCYKLLAMFANDGFASPFLFPDLQIDLTEVFAE